MVAAVSGATARLENGSRIRPRGQKSGDQGQFRGQGTGNRRQEAVRPRCLDRLLFPVPCLLPQTVPGLPAHMMTAIGFPSPLRRPTVQGNPKILEGLNRALTIELTAINQYFCQAKMCQNWGFMKLGAKHYEE